MPEFNIRLAQASDDANLRKLMSEIIMPGDMQMAFTREPDFFRASALEGRYGETLILENSQGLTVGMGSRSVKPAYINGQLSNIGYLSSLRILDQYRVGTGLVQGFRKLKELHQDRKTGFYLTTIVEGNENARKILESGRCGMPDYINQGRFITVAFVPRQTSILTIRADITIRTAKEDDRQMIVDFLNEYGKQKQFFPLYKTDDLNSNNGLLAGLRIRDFVIAFFADKIIGVLALWDQRAIKQTIIRKYSTKLNLTRHILNAFARFGGYPLLPRANSILDYRVLSLVCIKDNDTSIFSTMLNSALSGINSSLVLAGFHEHDPLLKVLCRLKHISYNSHLYTVGWNEDRQIIDSLDGRVPYLELGSL